MVKMAIQFVRQIPTMQVQLLAIIQTYAIFYHIIKNLLPHVVAISYHKKKLQLVAANYLYYEITPLLLQTDFSVKSNRIFPIYYMEDHVICIAV